MPDELVSPFEVTYDGRDAKRHTLEGSALGVSVVGSAKFYTAIAHFCMHGVVPRGRYRRSFAAYAKPATDGSWRQLWYIAPLIAGEYAIHIKLYNEAISFMFAKMTDSVKQLWTKPNESEAIVDKFIAAMQQESQMNKEIHEQQLAVIADGQREMAGIAKKLIDVLPALASATRNHGVDIVKPVGFTCSEITQFSNAPALATTITEPDADVIRAGEAAEVDAVATYKLNRIRELNLNTGHCVVDVEGVGELTGRITDPVLETPNNIYTRRMNDQGVIAVEAKAVKKNGEIQKLYISDAEDA